MDEQTAAVHTLFTLVPMHTLAYINIHYHQPNWSEQTSKHSQYAVVNDTTFLVTVISLNRTFSLTN